MKPYSNKVHSSYWLDRWEDDSIITDSLSDKELISRDLYKLASIKKAISNFVNIVTNQSIPVKFNTRGSSYTDGKSVVIGANVIDPTDFDIAVGLALHEGSHIKLSDFKLLNEVYSLVPKSIVDSAIKKGVIHPISTVKDIWNWVEDRRIDQFVFDSAPGYRNYYRSMYDKYFNDTLIDKALISDECTSEDIDSYMFRLINLHNKNTNLSKLKGLRTIYKYVGLHDINRLKSSKDTYDVAIEIFKEILSNLPSVSKSDMIEKPKDETKHKNTAELTDDQFEDYLDQISDESDDSDDSDETQSIDGSQMNSENISDDIENTPSSNSSNNKDTIKLSDKQQTILAKKIQKQKDFLRGDVIKKSVTKKESNILDIIEESGSEIKVVGSDVKKRGYGIWAQKGIECIIVNKLTKSLLESVEFPLTSYIYSEGILRDMNSKEVEQGIKLGIQLGKKLQIRSESKTTIYNRQKVGKIDKRLISSLGFGNQNVFSIFEIDSYKKANLHISIDGSGSMNGIKWRKTIINTVALCKAVDVISNLSIQVSVRTTSTMSHLPYVVIAYDSRVDKFSKAKHVFKYLTPGGTTPEGLCFEAISKTFVPASAECDSYFLNISDGEPYYQTRNFEYSGIPAAEHTEKMVKNIEAVGIKTLSYFVSDTSFQSSSYQVNLFTKMYGKGSQFVDITNISLITKTMNKLFLTK